jgi:hypothetical protein
VKKSSPLRATHVNIGTALPRHDREDQGRPELRHPKLQPVVERRGATALGGLSLASSLVRGLGLAQAIDSRLALLKAHRPYYESDHVLTHVYNLFTGGSAIEDIADLQQSEPVKAMLGATVIPDPTTAGDFLRRLDRDALHELDLSIDDAQRRVWRRRYGRRKQALGIVDLDSHVRHVYGDQKEGADFTYKGGFGYHPLVISLASTQECLRLVNRPGNVASAEGAAAQLESLAPLLHDRFKKVLVRGDSAFARQDIFDVCVDRGMYFAMVSPEQVNFAALAENLEERRWRPFRGDPEAGAPRSTKKRKRGRNVRRRKARQRGKRDLKLERQWVAEMEYRPARSPRSYRLVIRRQRIEESQQGELFELWRYRFVLTNLPRSFSTEDVVRQTYRRCDQENVIEQLQHGVAGMRMPTGSLLANSAFLTCARLAHNLKAWLAMLALPAETMRWEWKRFRKSFVYVAAQVVRTGRQVILRISGAHRFAEAIERGIVRLQT